MKKNNFLSLIIKKYSLRIKVLLIFLISNSILAQSNLYQRNIEFKKDSVYTLHSLSIFPTSLRFYHAGTWLQLDTSDYKLIDYKKIVFIRKLTLDSLSIQYRVLPIDFKQKYFKTDSSIVKQVAMGDIPIAYDFNIPDNTESDNLFGSKGMNYNGSFARGLSFGNTQNLVLNSNLNLQLSGKLSNDIEITGAISDNNIPLQAEGNTRQLREFDKLYIQIKQKNNMLLAGDYELYRPESYFMNYLKKLQGATFSNITAFNDSLTIKSKGSIAISRGKFARLIITQIEGNQGPYRLIGNEGEKFIVILSGTEKIYIDGKLLIRGQDADYTIDYNRAELIFTNKKLITKDIRIIAEYEYADQNYLRSIATGGSQIMGKKWKAYIQFYSEQDSKNSTGVQSLDSLDQLALLNAGDNFRTIKNSSVRPTVFSAQQILYKEIDTIVNGISYQILKYSTNKDSAKYSASFTPVGDNNGDYIQLINAANGRVYQWIAPDKNGKKRGAFDPIKQLVAPNLLQMIVVGGQYDYDPLTSIKVELATTHYDQNRFSSLDDGDNTGYASNVQLLKKIKWKNKWESNFKLNNEYITDNFKSLNPYRSAEFSRDWNLGNVSNNLKNELYNTVSFNVSKADQIAIGYENQYFRKISLLSGGKQLINATLNTHIVNVKAEYNLVQTDGIINSSVFNRPKFEISKSWKNGLKTGIYYEREDNKIKDTSNTLLANSFRYDLKRAYFEKNNESNGYGIQYSNRIDYLSDSKNLQLVSEANELNINGNFATNPSSRLFWNITYRDLAVIDTFLLKNKAQSTYLGRLEYNLSMWKSALVSNTNYEIGSGQEQKIAFQYIKVNPGEGVYIWVNRNNDTIPQLDEFEIAPFPDRADYVRISLFTNEYLRTNNIIFNQSIRFEPRSIWYIKKGILHTLANFSTQSILQINRKVGLNSGVSPWNPFELNIPDISLVATGQSIRNSLFLFRSNPGYSFEIGQSYVKNRFVTFNGFEQRSNDEQYFKLRWSIIKDLILESTFTQALNNNNSESFKSRNYNIENIKIEPSLTYFLSEKIRTILLYKYKKGVNNLSDPRDIVINNDLGVETTFIKSSSASIRLKFNYANISFSGVRNTPVEYVMLEGLQSGKNYLWSLNFDKLISKSIQLSLTYNGRKTGIVDIAHVGSAQLRALF